MKIITYLGKIAWAIVAILVLAGPSFGLPRGTVRLKSEDQFNLTLYNSDNFYSSYNYFFCGRINGVWTAAERVKGNKFLPLKAKRRNYLESARRAGSTKERARLRRLAGDTLESIRADQPNCEIGRPSCDSTTVSGPYDLKFDFTSAKSLALVDSNVICEGKGETRTNLRGVKGDGTIFEPTVSGFGEIESFMVLGSSVYLQFRYGINLTDARLTTDMCLFAEVPLSTGIPECITKNTTELPYSYGASDSLNRPQKDASGRLYYTSTKGLLKFENHTLTTIPTPEIYYFRFLVLPDGKVVVLESLVDGAGKLAVIYPDNTSKTITLSGIGDGKYYLNVCGAQQYTDDNVYIHFCGVLYTRPIRSKNIILRLLTANDSLDPRPWLDDAGEDPHFEISSVCKELKIADSMCEVNGVSLVQSASTSDGAVFELLGATGSELWNDDAKKVTLFQMYPEIHALDTGFERNTSISAIQNTLYVSGVIKNGLDGVVAYDITTKQFTDILGKKDQLSYLFFLKSSDSQTFMTEATDVDQGQNVILQYDPVAKSVTTKPTGTYSFKQFKTL